MGKYKTLSVLFTVFLLSRLFILLFFVDDTFQCEERFQGLVGKEIMDGTSISWLDYSPTNYALGPYLAGVITIPFYAIFGKNLFALKLTPLLFSSLSFILLFLFSYKYFNKRTAIITALLFLFSSPIFIFNSLSNQGAHTENILFTVAAMFLFYEIIFNNKKATYYFFLGFICGFGTYWEYTFLVTMAALFIVWFWHDSKIFLRRDFYIFWLGFFLWAIPWLFYNAPSRFIGLEIFNPLFETNYFSKNASLDVFLRFIKNIEFSALLNLGNIEHPLHIFLSKAYLLVYWLSFILILRTYCFSISKIFLGKEAFILLFPVTLITISTLYGQEFGYIGYFLTWINMTGICPFIFLTVAIGADKFFFNFRWFKYCLMVLLVIFVTSAGLRLPGHIYSKNFGLAFHRLAYAYIYLPDPFVNKYQGNFYKILDSITKLKVPQQREVLAQVFTVEAFYNEVPPNFNDYLKLSERVEEKYRPFFYKLLIKGIFYNSELSLNEMLNRIAELSSYVEEAQKPYFYEALGSLAVKKFPGGTEKYMETSSLVEEKYRPYYYRGLSDPLYISPFASEPFTEYVERYKECLSWLPEQYMPFYLEGVGEAMAKIALYDIASKLVIDDFADAASVVNFLSTLDKESKKYILDGMSKHVSYFIGPDNREYVERFGEYLHDQADREYFHKAISKL